MSAEAQRLINAAQGDFRVLVQAALQTGARYQELARLRVSDFNADAGTLHIRKTKTHKDRHIVLTDEGRSFFGQLAAGRPGTALLLGHEWKPSRQAPLIKEACEHAGIEPPLNFHALRHTWASLSVMGGMPLMVVARNLGHADTRMVERSLRTFSAELCCRVSQKARSPLRQDAFQCEGAVMDWRENGETLRKRWLQNVLDYVAKEKGPSTEFLYSLPQPGQGCAWSISFGKLDVHPALSKALEASEAGDMYPLAAYLHASPLCL